jgi:hypothetical protein
MSQDLGVQGLGYESWKGMILHLVESRCPAATRGTYVVQAKALFLPMLMLGPM